MKVLHINCNYLGTALHQNMVDTLNSCNIESQVFAPTYNAKLAKIKPKDYVTVSECFKKWDRILFDYKQSKIFKSVKNCYDITGFDIIHAYTLFTDGNCAMKLSKQYNIPYVVAVRNTDVNYFFKLMIHLRKRGLQIMLNAKAIFFLSNAYKQEVFSKYVPQKHKKELLEKTYVLPNGIDDFWLNNSVTAKKVIYDKNLNLVYAGRIDKNKNIPTTLKAMKILEDKGYYPKLTVGGNVEDKQEFEIIKNSKFVTYIPAKPKEELAEIYRENHIFVMPSFTETFGLVYAEAISQGLPVVYSEGQGFDGQFEEGVVGYRVKSSSPEQVAEAIIKIVDYYEKITENISKNAQKFNWGKIASEYIEIYRKV